MLITFTSDGFHDDYSPTVFDSYNKTVEYNGKKCILNLLDTTGGDDYDRLRPLSYPETEVVLAVFSLVNPDTLGRLKSKFIPEVRSKFDDWDEKRLRKDSQIIRELQEKGQVPVSTEEAESFLKEMKLQDYVEAKNNDVKQAFIAAVKSVVDPEKGGKSGKSGCMII